MGVEVSETERQVLLMRVAKAIRDDCGAKYRDALIGVLICDARYALDQIDHNRPLEDMAYSDLDERLEHINKVKLVMEQEAMAIADELAARAGRTGP
jgi:hypothetical protein